MNYAERAERAKQAGTVKRISQDIRKLKDGDVILGKFLGREQVKSNKKGLPDFYRYHFDTDTGPIGTIFGQVFDGREGIALEPGALYEIESKGKRDLEGGKKVNICVVSMIEPGAISGEQELDLPENDSD